MPPPVRCGAIIFTRDYDYLILVQNKYVLLEQNKIMWGLPKGHIEDNESYVECAKREIYEETGLHIDITKMHPKLCIHNTYYFPVMLKKTQTSIKESMNVKDTAEIHCVAVHSIQYLLQNLDMLNYELKTCLTSFLHRAKYIASHTPQRFLTT